MGIPPTSRCCAVRFRICNSCGCFDGTRCSRRFPRRGPHKLACGKSREGNSASGKAEFDAQLIAHCLEDTEREERIWSRFFDTISIRPFQVEYEELCRDYQGTIGSVLEFLEIRLPRQVRVGPPTTIRQTDAVSRAWEERFLAERPSAYSPATG